MRMHVRTLHQMFFSSVSLRFLSPTHSISLSLCRSIRAIFGIVFNSLYAINSCDKLTIAHLRFAQFRKLLHIAIFGALFLPFYHIVHTHSTKIKIKSKTKMLSFTILVIFRVRMRCSSCSSAVLQFYSHNLLISEKINCCKLHGVI